jgi:uncharacterized protein YecT (DUF1311 family)
MNRTIHPLLACLLIGHAASAQKTTLESAQAEFAAADQRLNVVYQKAVSSYTDEDRESILNSPVD